LNYFGIFISDQTIIAHHSTVEAKTQTSTAQNGYLCKDCPITSPSKNDSFLPNNPNPGHQASLTEKPSTDSFPKTTLYCRDNNRRHKPGECL